MKNKVLFIVGPTGVGKSAIALILAKKLKGEIISADSMQVYRGMDIGTAKPTKTERKQIPHHLIDILSLQQGFSAFQFQQLAVKAIRQIEKKKKLPIIVGGTGLYTRTLVEGWLEQPSLKSLGYEAVLIGINKERPILYQGIEKRVDKMFRKGLLKEAKQLSSKKISPTAKVAIGYREIFQFLKGEISLERAKELIKRNSRRFAKRQLTWFRKEKNIHWFHTAENESGRETAEKIINFLSSKN